jgi:hypothetical protein
MHDTNMVKGESVASYLTWVAQVKNELAAVGEVISDSELVRIVLKGFTKEWEVFVKCVVGQEHLPYWSILWDIFTQEDIQEGSHRSGHKGYEVDEENVSLTTKNKSKKQGSSMKYLRKVRCFIYNQYGSPVFEEEEEEEG